MKPSQISALLLVIVLAMTSLTGCASETDYHSNTEAYVKTMNYHDGFTILQLTDIHWSGGSQIGDEQYGSEEYLRKVIAEVQAHAGQIDLIEVTGDTFMLANRKAVRTFIDLMTDIGIPYAMVWGNHDRSGSYNPNWISRKFLNAPNCLYTEVDHDNVHERGNYVINLMNGSKAAWQLVQFDSGASYRQGGLDIDLTYDYLRDDQFEWMSTMHGLVGADVPVICYYHIAQREHDIVYDAVQAGSTDYKYKFFKHEGFADSDYSPVTFDVFAANNVKAAFLGHDHSNDWTFTTPDGITYGLGVKTGYELYSTHIEPGETESNVDYSEGFDLIGASLVTLNDANGDFTLEHLYLNERDEGDFVMWVEY